jgi:hypothetical protein
MEEHPLLRMWRDLLDAEIAQGQAQAARRAVREAERGAWYAAWSSYKAHGMENLKTTVRPRWWNVLGWALYSLRLHAPGRSN